MKAGRELLLPDLKTGMVVLLEAVPPPEPLYLPGTVIDVVSHCVRVRMGLGGFGGFVRLHASKAGKFVTNEDRAVRVFESEGTH